MPQRRRGRAGAYCRKEMRTALGGRRSSRPANLSRVRPARYAPSPGMACVARRLTGGGLRAHRVPVAPSSPHCGVCHEPTCEPGIPQALVRCSHVLGHALLDHESLLWVNHESLLRARQHVDDQAGVSD